MYNIYASGYIPCIGVNLASRFIVRKALAFKDEGEENVLNGRETFRVTSVAQS